VFASLILFMWGEAVHSLRIRYLPRVWNFTVVITVYCLPFLFKKMSFADALTVAGFLKILTGSGMPVSKAMEHTPKL
jgi:hypothetical protein